MKRLVDACTESTMWADFLVANKDAIMLQRKCEVLNDLAEELENKLASDGANTIPIDEVVSVSTK